MRRWTFSAGTAFDQVDLEIDSETHDVTAASASVVTTFADVGPGLTPAADAIVSAADAKVAPLVNRVVGTARAAITRTESPAGESALGNLGGAIDLEALVDYVQAFPGQQIVAAIERRIQRLH